MSTKSEVNVDAAPFVGKPSMQPSRPQRRRGRLRSDANFFIYLSIFLFGIFSAAGCSTGIEATKKVKPTRAERRALIPTPEEELASQFRGTPLKDWSIGREFLCGDNKLSLILLPLSGNRPDSLKGKVLRFAGTSRRLDPSGGEELLIILSEGENRYALPTSQSPQRADTVIDSASLPLLIDPLLAAIASATLSGKEVWTLSPIWENKEGENVEGAKFVPVTIAAVQPGNSIFPMHVAFTDASGREAWMWMSPGGDAASVSGARSRPFNALFTLSDPHLKYPSIAPEVWDLITRSQLREGMTKEECRLSIGNPQDVDSGHDWHNTIDIWTYPDGMFLQFEDGLLIRYRH